MRVGDTRRQIAFLNATETHVIYVGVESEWAKVDVGCGSASVNW